jgi:hypothetical protein
LIGPISTPTRLTKRLFVKKILRQQVRQIVDDDRIVSLSQPHIRPIVRGKAGTPVEFGAKLVASVTVYWKERSAESSSARLTPSFAVFMPEGLYAIAQMFILFLQFGIGSQIIPHPIATHCYYLI